MKKPKKGCKLVKGLFGKEIEIPEEWKVEKFNDRIKLEYGSSLTAEQRDNAGNPVYGSGGIIGFHSKPIVNNIGIVVARKGSIGNIFYEKQDFFPIDTVYYITKNETTFNLLFLFYYLTNMKLENLAIVTSKPGISRNEIYSLKIIFPLLPEQQKIASILSRVDALIENTQQVMDKAWRLKKGLMQQLLTKGIGHKKLKKTTLGKIVKFSSGEFLPKTDHIVGDIPIYGGNGIAGYHDKELINYSTIIFGRVGVYCGSVYMSRDRSWITDNAIFIKNISNQIKLEYLYRFLSRLNITLLAEISAQPKISQDILNHIKI